MVRRFAAGQALVAAVWVTTALPAQGRQSLGRATVALVMDTSGSLLPADVAAARKLGIDLLNLLPAGSEIALFTFDDQSRLVLERTRDPLALRDSLAKVKIAGQFTVLHDALYDASHYLERAPAARKAIVLVTDGRDENSALNLDDALDAARLGRIPILTVGAGRVESRVLRRIAKLTGGEYFPADNASAGAIASQIPPAPAATAINAPASADPPEGARSSTHSAVGPPPSLAAPTGEPSPNPPVATTDRPGTGRRLEWVLGLLALVLGMAGLAFFAFGRKRAAQCPTCDRPLESPGALCPSCTNGAAGSPEMESLGPEEDGPAPTGLADEFSPTVLTRMNATEEYLEKTITLREKPVLTVTRGPGLGGVFNLSTHSALSVGRAKANDIRIEDVAVSSQHCRVRPEAGDFVLHDLKSTNGTFVNDRRVSRHVLADGDVIKVGETLLQFRREQSRA